MVENDGPSEREDDESYSAEDFRGMRSHVIRKIERLDNLNLSWQIGRRRHIALTSRRLGLMVILGNLAAGAAGGLMILLGAPSEVGVALIVGAVFALGSFASQAWSQQMDRERAYYEWNWSSEDATTRRQLVGNWKILDQQIEEAVRREQTS